MKKKQNTQNDEILGQMEELARNLGITVRYEKDSEGERILPWRILQG